MGLRTLNDWLDRHPAAGDVLLALAVSPLVLGGTLSLAVPDRSQWWHLGWGLLYLVPLLWRRSRPDLAAAALVVPHLIQLAVLHNFNLANVTVPLVLYAVAAHGRYPRSWLAGAVLAGTLAAYDWNYSNPPPGNVVSDAQMLLWTAQIWLLITAVCVAAWFMGRLARQRRATVDSLRDRAAALEREHEQRLRLTAEEERSRIAREMHDVVAHSLSVIVVQADGAAYTLHDSRGEAAQREEIAARALHAIAGTARTALGETRRLVGVLRHDGEAPELAPQAALEQVGELVARVRDAGFAATYELAGDPSAHPSVGAGVEMAVYRVVQESLTNVMKHAGPGASVRVRIEHAADELRVTVQDDGRGSAGERTDGPGHGLVGMRERVAAYNGTLVTRARESGGYEMLASFPVTAAP